jgi:hypothetical protein
MRITFSDASLEMAVLILVRPKGPPANRRYSTAFPSVHIIEFAIKSLNVLVFYASPF